MSGLRKHGAYGYSHWGCRCEICTASYHSKASELREKNKQARLARAPAKAAARVIRQAEARRRLSERIKADRKARPDFYKEKDRRDRERNGARKAERGLAKRRRIAAERKAAKEASRPAREEAAKRFRKARNREAYATLKREHPEVLESRRVYAASWAEKNRGRILAKKRAYYAENRTKILADSRAYAKTHPEVRRRTKRKKRKKDPCVRITEGVRKRLRELLVPLQRKSEHTTKLTGCTRSELRAYLESMFLPGMSWENYGTAWHVDHIKPCALFDVSDKEQQRKCFHYSNLRPLWAELNIERGCSLDYDVDYEISQAPYPA